MTPLTTAQWTVLQALATGATVTAAAELASVSRPTIYKWFDDPHFQQALEQARQEAFQTLQHRLLTLSAKALDKLEAVLDDPRSSPSVLLRAALAILNRKNWNIPAPESSESAEPAQSTPSDPPPAPDFTKIDTFSNSENAGQQTPRGAPCPCGSGQKFKRCCGRNAPPVLHAKAA